MSREVEIYVRLESDSGQENKKISHARTEVASHIPRPRAGE